MRGIPLSDFPALHQWLFLCIQFLFQPKSQAVTRFLMCLLCPFTWDRWNWMGECNFKWGWVALKHIHTVCEFLLMNVCFHFYWNVCWKTCSKMEIKKYNPMQPFLVQVFCQNWFHRADLLMLVLFTTITFGGLSLSRSVWTDALLCKVF